MTILLLGLDYRTAPLHVREACFFSPALTRLHLTNSVADAEAARLWFPREAEIVILSTCSRLEIYAFGETGEPEAVLRSWRERVERRASVTDSHFYRLADERAVEHLLRVATGVEAIHEPTILEQLASALELAHGCGTARGILSDLFQCAITTGRQTLFEAGRERNASLPMDAIRVLCRFPAEFGAANVLVVGGGRMAQIVADALQESNDRLVGVISRSPAAAERVARKARGVVFPWYQMRSALSWGDIIVAATATLNPILDSYDIAAVLPHRRGRPLHLLDLGLPRNVRLNGDRIETVTYYGLDDWFTVLEDIVIARGIERGPHPSARLLAERAIEEANRLWSQLAVAGATA